jgi:hypothetical protein
MEIFNKTYFSGVQMEGGLVLPKPRKMKTKAATDRMYLILLTPF